MERRQTLSTSSVMQTLDPPRGATCQARIVRFCWLVAPALLGCNGILGFEEGRPIEAGQGGGADGGVSCAELGDGDPCDGGRCYGGECCTGCWSGTECSRGDGVTACGLQGRACEACGCESDSCEQGACAPVDPIRSVGLGSQHSCVATHGGVLWCWGRNREGQLGLGDTVERSRPERVGDQGDWAVVHGGEGHSCALTIAGARWCWGSNTDGQLGIGDTSEHLAPTLVTETRTNRMVLGSNHGCATNSSRLLSCWGANDVGQLGLGEAGPSQLEPIAVGDAQWESIAARRKHGCGIQFDTSLWCWGYNIDGELGLNHQIDVFEPNRVGAETSWHQVATAGYSTCAIRDPGELWCWGGNSTGQLGIGVLGPNTHSTTPVRAGDEADWTQIAAGPRAHLCGLRANGELWCWGNNDNGQVGSGSLDHEPAPVQVGPGEGWDDISLGGEHSCAVRAGGALWCWGDDTQGQVGAEQGGQVLEPVRICF